MHSKLACRSISDIPAAATFSRTDRVYVTLPVVILAVRQLSMGVLLVTDFTANSELGYVNGKSPQSLPDEFLFRNLPLDAAKVMAVGVPASRLSGIWRDLTANYPEIASFDYRDSAMCNVSSVGAVAEINFKISIYDGCLEGFLGHLRIIGRHNGASGAPEDVPAPDFDAFIKRYAAHMDTAMYDRLKSSMPLEKYITRPAEKRRPEDTSAAASDKPPGQNAPTGRTGPIAAPGAATMNAATALDFQDSRAEFPPPKARRLEPRAAVYQQQVSQPAIESSLLEDFSDCGSTFESSQDNAHWNLHSINVVEWAAFTRIQCHTVKPGTCFEFSSVISSIFPGTGSVFVKPYGKTLKVASFKALLEQNVSVELHTEAEACAFFEIDEIEVAINHIGEFTSALERLQGQKLRIKTEKKIMVFAQGQRRSYWGFASTLADLTSQVQ